MHNIAIVSVNQNKYSETFIHQQVAHLPAKVHYLFDGYLPSHYSTEGVNGQAKTFATQTLLHRLQTKTPRERLQLAIARYLVKHRIEAVLAEYGPGGVEMMPVCKVANVPLIVHFHGYDAYRQDIMQSYGRQYSNLFEQAAAVIAVSKHMCQRLAQLGCPPHKIHYNPYGANSQLFNAQCRPAENPPLFVSVGRFAETKAPHLTILAFAEALQQIPNAQLIMAGNGHLLEACQILVQALQISHAVTFCGAVRPEQVAQLMQQARAFVQHSITTPANDTEGTPVAILEACASGLPVIATQHAGIPDVVAHNKTGFLVQEGDIGAMAACMIQLAANPIQAGEMGRAAAAYVNTHFTLQQHIDKLWQIILHCIEKPN